MMEYIRSHGSSWAVKVVFLIIIVVFVFWGVGSFRSTPQGAVVTVDGDPIMVDALQNDYSRIRDAMRQETGDSEMSDAEDRTLRYELLANAVNNRLLLKEAERTGIVVTPAEIRRIIASMAEFRNAEGQFDKALYEEGVRARRATPADFEAQIRQELLLNKLRSAVMDSAVVSETEARLLFDYAFERRTLEYVLFNAADYADKVDVQQEQLEAAYAAYQDAWREPASLNLDYVRLSADELAARFTPTEEAVAAYYTANAETRFARPERVQLRHILVIAPQGTQPAIEEQALAKIAQAEAELAAGTAFAEVAAKYSEDPSTASTGGDLGWIERGLLVEPLDQAFAMQAGEVSKALRSSIGYHIIQVDAREERRVLPLEEARAEIVRALGADEAASLLPGLSSDAQDLLNAGKSLEEIAAELNLPLHTSGLVPATAANEEIKVDDADLAMLLALPAGTLLNYPLESQDGFVLVRVNEANPERVKPLEQVAEDVKTMVVYEQSLKLAEEDARANRDAFAGADVPEAFAGRVTVGPEFTRNTLDAGPGFSVELPQAAFAAAPGDWLPGVYTTQTGAAIVRVASMRSPAESEWLTEQAGFTDRALNSRRQELLTLFVMELHSRADIREHDMTFLNQPQ